MPTLYFMLHFFFRSLPLPWILGLYLTVTLPLTVQLLTMTQEEYLRFLIGLFILVDKLRSWEENQGFSDIGRKERTEGLRRQYTHRIKGWFSDFQENRCRSGTYILTFFASWSGIWSCSILLIQSIEIILVSMYPCYSNCHCHHNHMPLYLQGRPIHIWVDLKFNASFLLMLLCSLIWVWVQ